MKPHLSSPAFLQSAYTHCTRIAIGLFTSRGQLPPQLFFVGPPAQGDDASTSKVARTGEQAMAIFHASAHSADQLLPFIRKALNPAYEQGKSLQQQIGSPAVAVHVCHALVSQDAPLTYPEDTQPAVRADGRRECLLVTVHTSTDSHSTMCPIYRDASGAQQSAIAPLALAPTGA
ncbi:MAG: hypothetical protein KJZ76_05015 [Burkholderiaceae bacterium]|jgi:hypothetical protein|nr:hypothetical protein [Burkholderiaceae bacterium]TXJ10672.1 MAG: hypothetical protein E6Q29_05655 [Alicycliphilus sp.]